jgi:hypothetical protein
MAAQRLARLDSRAQEKRESRAHDLERLARGEISSAALQIENGFFSALDMHSITLVRSSGVRYRLPSAQDPVKEVAISSQTTVYVKSMKIGPSKAPRKAASRKRALRRAGA